MRLYKALVESDNPSIAWTAQRLLALKEMLEAIQIDLRWPPPPFNQTFEERLFEELTFQLRWRIEILELHNQLTPEERQSVKIPDAPLTEESVVQYVSAQKQHIQNRSFWALSTLFIFEDDAAAELITQTQAWLDTKMDRFRMELITEQRHLQSQFDIETELSERISRSIRQMGSVKRGSQSNPASSALAWQFVLSTQFKRIPGRLSDSIQQAFRTVDRCWFVSSKRDGALDCTNKNEAIALWKKIQRKARLSGKWAGQYTQYNKAHAFEQELMFSSGRLSGDGSDGVGQFKVKGSYDIETGELNWIKSYIGRHNVEYTGIFDGSEITGTWRIHSDGGAFKMTPVAATPRCYSSYPVLLGYGADNSAPYMHVTGLYHLQEHLQRPHLRILDLGCGTGYVSAILATVAKEPAYVIGIDHVRYLVQKGEDILSWFLPELSPVIRLIEGDVRFGLGHHQFDVIHLGAPAKSNTELEALIESLAIGGKMVGPVHIKNKQHFVTVTKTENVKICLRSSTAH